MKRFLAAILGFALLTSPAAAASYSYEVPDSQTAQVGQSIITIWELTEGNWDSRREGRVFSPGQYGYETANTYLCPNEKILAGEYPCNFAESGADLYGSNILPVCKSDVDNFCVESMTFSLSDRVVVGQYFDDAGGDSFEAIPELGLEPGGLVSLWKVPGAANSAGVETYAVSVRSRQNFNPYLKRIQTISLDLSVTPYLEVQGNFYAPSSREGKDVNGLNKVYGGVPQGCTWSDEGRCGKAADFVGTPSVKLTIRASNELTGWFRGRISGPELSISKFSEKSNRISISGQPVEVPRFHVYADASNTPIEVQQVFPRGSGGTGRELFEGNSSKQVFATGGERTYQVLEGMRAAVKDTAAGTSTLWSIESIPLGNQPCFAKADGVLGVVSTNATAYDGTAPGFEDGQLTYKVAGLHYAPDGKTLNRGTYDLVMRSDIARCLYGFSSAPISAKIQVLTEQGEAVVASTVVNERNGWLNLAAYGFTFSEKNIKVELTQFSPRKVSLSKFTGKSTSLTNSQKRQLQNGLSSAAGATSITCTAYGLKTTSKVSSMARAKSACAYANTFAPAAKVALQVKVTSQKSWDGKVDVVVR